MFPCPRLGVLVGSLLVARLRVPPLASSPERAPAVLADLGASIGLPILGATLLLVSAPCQPGFSSAG